MTGGSVDPLGKHWKFSKGNSKYFAGRISEGEEGKRLLDIFSYSDDMIYLISIIDDGQVIDGTGKGVADIADEILAAAQRKWGNSITDWDYATGSYSVGNTIPEWDTYELIS